MAKIDIDDLLLSLENAETADEDEIRSSINSCYAAEGFTHLLTEEDLIVVKAYREDLERILINRQ